MTQKELDEIIDGHLFENDCHLLRHEKDTVRKIARSLYNKGVIDSSESAECEGVNKITFDKVNKQTILKNLIP